MMINSFLMENALYGKPIVKPNLITGEGRSRPRPFSAHKQKDLKKSKHRKMTKKSRRINRR